MLPTHLLHGDFFLKGEAGGRQYIVKKKQKIFMKHPAHKVIPYMTMDNGTSCMCNKVHIHLESAHYSVGRAGWSQPPALGHPHHLQNFFLSCKKKDINASVLSECSILCHIQGVSYSLPGSAFDFKCRAKNVGHPVDEFCKKSDTHKCPMIKSS